MSGQGQDHHYEFGRWQQVLLALRQLHKPLLLPRRYGIYFLVVLLDSSIRNCGPRRASQHNFSFFQHRSHPFIILELTLTSKEVVRNSTIHLSMKSAPISAGASKKLVFPYFKFEYF